MLGVEGDTRHAYDSYDRDRKIEMERQMDLDIPRCHQYHPLLASSEGHAKLGRVLKTWALAEEGEYVYWQGLESICAPFVALNFNDESLAFCSMLKFIRKFCAGFFVKDNSFLMREYVGSFRTLLSFHDPELASHLFKLGLGPELYALPWFMTFYARICY